jgi:hypothetical protein
VIVLDENILESQRQLLRAWRIRCRQIGRDLGRAGMADLDVLTLLRRLSGPTFFTRDLNLGRPMRCDRRYCIAILDVRQHETAAFLRRVLRHPDLNTRAKRMGSVVRATHTGLRVWRDRPAEAVMLTWPR